MILHNNVLRQGGILCSDSNGSQLTENWSELEFLEHNLLRDKGGKIVHIDDRHIQLQAHDSSFADTGRGGTRVLITSLSGGDSPEHTLSSYRIASLCS